MPMHFLVKYVDTRQETLLDPFHGGQTLTPEDCRARLETIAGRPVPLLPHYFQETPKRQILYRMLNNLKHIYLARQESQRAGRVIEQMWLVNPGDPEALRDRGQLYLQEQAFSSAMAWLSAYLERAPDAPDAGQVQQLIAQAAEQRALRN
jgi:regulator of sirC expression with transglutaminase-like and TPR domain